MEERDRTGEVRRKQMTRKIRRCRSCGLYSLSQASCPACGGNLIFPDPPKFSLQDRHIDLRAALRRKIR